MTKVVGVPLYSGFLYAGVGSFTHHVLPDVRWLIAAGFVVVLRRTWVGFTVGARRHRIPLALAFVAIGFFLWVAENAATVLGAWKYPDQLDVWRLVHPGKFGAWSLLVSLSFVLVATLKSTEGRLYGDADREPSVRTQQRA